MKSAYAFEHTPRLDTDVYTIFENLPNEQRQLASRLPSIRSQPETELEVLKPFEEYDNTDALAPARGVMVAVMLSAPFWAAVIWWLI
ncbi:MAG TPA: hypothetical protein VFR66_00555 [Burkholderiales bacterium]|nr:hypothetical protein [Burkholderiales bacterium]